MMCENCEQMKDLFSSLHNIFSSSSVETGGDEINDLRFKEKLGRFYIST
jgi:hypothetical protein